jgi:hypothetical protein
VSCNTFRCCTTPSRIGPIVCQKDLWTSHDSELICRINTPLITTQRRPRTEPGLPPDPDARAGDPEPRFPQDPDERAPDWQRQNQVHQSGKTPADIFDFVQTCLSLNTYVCTCGSDIWMKQISIK